MTREMKENIYNIPNLLTISRIIITFVAVYLIFAGFNIIYIVVAFCIGALTDFFDGQIARHYNLKTEFGRKADILADRFLMTGIFAAILIKFTRTGLLDNNHLLQLFLIVTREIIAVPFALVLFTSGKEIPKARWIGKWTTTLQGFALPMIILSIYYPFWSFSLYFAIATGIVGLISAFYFIHDVFVCEECKK